MEFVKTCVAWFVCKLLTIKLALGSKRVKTNTFFVERKNWSIRHDGESIAGSLKKRDPAQDIFVTDRLLSISYGHVHFGSQFLWEKYYKFLPRCNTYSVAYYHGNPDHSDFWANHFESFLSSERLLENIVSPNHSTTELLRAKMEDTNKIEEIPIGVDTASFSLSLDDDQVEISNLKKSLGISSDALVIGSFQKDGVGWGSGDEPKLIKGPDLLISAVEYLQAKYNIHVLLSGPARGYVKNQLCRLNVAFSHVSVENPEDLNHYYKLLDFYCMLSREEGGPKGILEALASGIPVIATPTGMAPDIINSNNGVLCNNFEKDNINLNLDRLLENLQNYEGLAIRRTVLDYDWASVSALYSSRIFVDIL